MSVPNQIRRVHLIAHFSKQFFTNSGFCRKWKGENRKSETHETETLFRLFLSMCIANFYCIHKTMAMFCRWVFCAVKPLLFWQYLLSVVMENSHATSVTSFLRANARFTQTKSSHKKLSLFQEMLFEMISGTGSSLEYLSFEFYSWIGQIILYERRTQVKHVEKWHRELVDEMNILAWIWHKVCCRARILLRKNKSFFVVMEIYCLFHFFPLKHKTMLITF